MKKTLVALSVLAAAGSAQAIELYNQDKVTVSMTGDVQVQYIRDLNDGDEFRQSITDADFGFDTKYSINDDVAVGAFWEFKGGSVDDNDPTSNNDDKAGIGNVYMGLYSQTVGSIRFGKLGTVLDDAGIGKDKEFGTSAFFSQGSPFSGPETVRYDLDKGSFYGAVAYQQDKAGNNGLGEDGSYYDAKVGARFADVDARAYVAKGKIKGATVTDADEKFWALEAEYTGIESVGLALGYYDIDVDGAKAKSLQLAADYTWEKLTFAAGWGQTDQDGEDKVQNVYGNVAYALAPSTDAFFELGKTNASDSQLGVVVGLSANF